MFTPTSSLLPYTPQPHPHIQQQPPFNYLDQQQLMNMNNHTMLSAAALVLPAPPAAAAPPPAPPPPKGRKRQPTRKIACVVCHLAKTSCNGQRPCDRCVRVNKTHLCVDRPSKRKSKQQQQQSTAALLAAQQASSNKSKNKKQQNEQHPHTYTQPQQDGLMHHTQQVVFSVPPLPSNVPHLPFPNNSSAYHQLVPQGVSMMQHQQQQQPMPILHPIPKRSAAPPVAATNHTPAVVQEDHRMSSADDQLETESIRSTASSASSSAESASASSAASSPSRSGFTDKDTHKHNNNKSSSGCGDPANAETLVEVSKVLLAVYATPFTRDHLLRYPTGRNSLYLLAHLQDSMNTQDFLSWLQYIGYTEVQKPSDAVVGTKQEQTTPTEIEQEQIDALNEQYHSVWMCVGTDLPAVTFPSRFVFTWSHSPYTAMEDQTFVSAATLIIEKTAEGGVQSQTGAALRTAKPTEHTDHHQQQHTVLSTPTPVVSPQSQEDSHSQLSNSQSSMADTPSPSLSCSSLESSSTGSAQPHSQLSQTCVPGSLTPSTPLCRIILPMSVHVNRTFERMFGYTQLDIKQMFTREGKKALRRLMKDESLSNMHRSVLDNIQQNNVIGGVGHYIDFTNFVINITKFGSEVLTLIQRRGLMDTDGLWKSVIYSWVVCPTMNEAQRKEFEELQKKILGNKNNNNQCIPCSI